MVIRICSQADNFFEIIKGGHRSERTPNGFISGPVHKKKYEPDRRSGPVRFIDFTGSVHRFYRSGPVRFIDFTGPVRSGS